MALAGAVLLTLLALPSTASAMACSTSSSGAPTMSGGTIRTSGSGSCDSLAVTVEVCIELIQSGANVTLSCASDAAQSGQTARATATAPCVLSGRYRSSFRVTHVNAQGETHYSGQTWSSQVSITCPLP